MSWMTMTKMTMSWKSWMKTETTMTNLDLAHVARGGGYGRDRDRDRDRAFSFRSCHRRCLVDCRFACRPCHRHHHFWGISDCTYKCMSHHLCYLCDRFWTNRTMMKKICRKNHWTRMISTGSHWIGIDPNWIGIGSNRIAICCSGLNCSSSTSIPCRMNLCGHPAE